MKKNTVVFLCMVLSALPQLHAQILHTESFNVILDSSKQIQGSILPDFRFQNLKRDLLEFENLADMSIKFGENAFTVANKIELSRFGKQTISSGGYVYAEYRRIEMRKLAFEVYGQVHWAEARGMERKYAGGINLRWRMITTQKMGFYGGVGPFYEFERWNYNGVSNPDTIPFGFKPIENSLFKLGAYLSFKFAPFDKIFVDLSVYSQARPENTLRAPRLASSSRITYKITKHIGFSLLYQNIYDPNPVVPIDRLYNHINSGISINF